MGRRSRKFLTRIGALAVGVAVGSVAYRRWTLLPWHVAPLPPTEIASSCFSSSASSPPSLDCSLGSREARWRGLQGSSAQYPFDLLVVGGGVGGLYVAVDAARRGLRTALVEAGDLGEGPLPVGPGAFPLCQRAIRQREWGWARLAWEGLEAAAIWRNVAPDACAAAPVFASAAHSGPSWGSWILPKDTTAVWTLLPALHAAEMLELAAAAVGSSLLSFFCGGPLQYSTVASSAAVVGILPGLEGRACGGVWVRDVYLDPSRAVLQLAKTAEALGVCLLNYTPLCGIEYCSSGEAVSSECTTPLIKATVSRDVASFTEADGSKKRYGSSKKAHGSVCTIYTRGIINCAGAWVDSVKELTPCNALDAVPTAFDFYTLHSYLVAPRNSVYDILSSPLREGLSAGNRDRQQDRLPFPWYSALCEKWSRRYGNTGGFERVLPAFQASSTLYSFSTSMVLPWYDRTILLGPSISRLERLPIRFPSSFSSYFSPEELIRPKDNYHRQITHITSALAATGIGLDLSNILACVSTIIPVLKDTKAVPWASDLFYKGYHISTFQKCAHPSEGVVETEESLNANLETFRPPFVHVYGGTPLMARRIAEEAVDAFLNNTSAIPEQIKKTLKKCSTKNLQLLSYEAIVGAKPQIETKSSSVLGEPSTGKEKDSLKESTEASVNQVEEPLLWVKRLVLGGYVEHLSDLIFRRSHVACTSPAEALHALPYLANVLSEDLMWDTRRKKSEIELAKALVESMAVRVNPKGG